MPPFGQFDEIVTILGSHEIANTKREKEIYRKASRNVCVLARVTSNMNL